MYIPCLLLYMPDLRVKKNSSMRLDKCSKAKSSSKLKSIGSKFRKFVAKNSKGNLFLGVDNP